MPDQPDFDVDDDGDMLMDANGTGEGISKIKMNELVSSYLKAQTLEVLVENAMEEAVVRYVDKEDTDAIKEWVAGVAVWAMRELMLGRWYQLCDGDTEGVWRGSEVEGQGQPRL